MVAFLLPHLLKLIASGERFNLSMKILIAAPMKFHNSSKLDKPLTKKVYARSTVTSIGRTAQ
jgi:hypothetical protein